MSEFNKDIDTSDFDEFDFGFELVDGPQSETPETQVPTSVSVDTTEIDDRLETLEGKINNILNIVSLNDDFGDLKQALEDQGSDFRAVVDRIEQKEEELEKEYESKLEELEQLVLPLLVNLTKNPEKDYIRWPNRAESVQKHINKILEVTRGNGD